VTRARQPTACHPADSAGRRPGAHRAAG